MTSANLFIVNKDELIKSWYSLPLLSECHYTYIAVTMMAHLNASHNGIKRHVWVAFHFNRLAIGGVEIGWVLNKDLIPENICIV